MKIVGGKLKKYLIEQRGNWFMFLLISRQIQYFLWRFAPVRSAPPTMVEISLWVGFDYPKTKGGVFSKGGVFCSELP